MKACYGDEYEVYDRWIKIEQAKMKCSEEEADKMVDKNVDWYFRLKKLQKISETEYESE